jgi:hypothetical protein
MAAHLAGIFKSRKWPGIRQAPDERRATQGLAVANYPALPLHNNEHQS